MTEPQPGIAACDAAVQGHRVRYLSAGSGPAIVLVHGLLGHSFSWRFTIPALAPHFTIYAPDLPGIGFSDRLPGMDGSMPAAAARLVGFCDALGLSRFDLLGTSHGGALAAIVAAESGNRIRRLVLVAPVNPWSRAGWKRTAILSTAPGSWLLRRSWLRLPALNRFVLTRLYADPKQVSPATLAGYLEPLKIAGSADYVLGVIRGWHRDLPALEPVYRRIRVPTLLLWGDRDPAVRPASAARVQAAIAGSRLLILPGVGHLPYEEDPGKFNRALLEFLGRD